MPLITLHTRIYAPPERCFDLSTSVDLHKLSVRHTEEEAVSGRTRGLLQLHEQVTWRARHLGAWFTMSMYLSAYQRPAYFRDEMLRGPFRSLVHDHYFKAQGEATLMTDKLRFTSPAGVLGRWADTIILKRHFTELLLTRNEVIKTFAETDQWKEVLPDRRKPENGDGGPETGGS